MKKYLLSVITVICLSIFTYSSSSISYADSHVHIPVKSNTEVEKIFSDNVKKYVDNLNMLRDRSYYSSEIVGTETVTVGGYAGNQPSGGSKFSTGGGFYWADKGGPTISASVNFGVGFQDIYSFSVSLGIATDNGTFGYFVEVPNTRDHFKLYITKTYRVQKINIYKHSNGKKELFNVIHQKEMTAYDFTAKVV